MPTTESRGLLEDTIVFRDDGIWPDAVQPGEPRQRHNPFAFTVWLARGGRASSRTVLPELLW